MSHTNPKIQIVCASIAAISYVFMHVVKARKFHRRNPAGVEQFSSYTTSVLIRGVEATVYAIAKLFFYFFGIMFLASFLEKLPG